MDLFEKCRSFTTAREAIAGGYYPYFVAFEGNDGATARLDGRDIVMAGSNNYLGLTKHPRVLAAAAEALRRSGSSCTGSRLLNGNLELHEELEAELAAYLGKPAALVFSTGYGANLGTISGLVGRDDEVVFDSEAHASAIDGARSTSAKIRVFDHNDVAALREQLAATAPGAGRLVVVDGVYSMAGDLCPLDQVVEACDRYDARLLVDDAHGVGVVGGGHGTAAFHGLTDKVDLVTVTFSKAFASIGGAVAADEDVVHYLRHHARAEIFSASMTPASTAAALEALRIAKEEPWRAEESVANARFVAESLAALGLDAATTPSPIVPVHTGDLVTTVLAWRRLMELGVYVNAVLPPAASPRLRLSFSAMHSHAQLERVVDAFGTVLGEGLISVEGSAA